MHYILLNRKSLLEKKLESFPNLNFVQISILSATEYKFCFNVSHICHPIISLNHS